MSQKPDVNLETLRKIFTIPESEDSTLGKIEKEISENLLGFLKQHIVSAETPPANLEKTFKHYRVRKIPYLCHSRRSFSLKVSYRSPIPRPLLDSLDI